MLSPEDRKTMFFRIKIASAVVATLVGLLTLAEAWPKELWLAHRGYVDERINEKINPIIPTLNDLARWQADDTIAKLDAETAQWKIKMPTEQDQQTRDMMQRRLDELAIKRKEIIQRQQALK